MLAQNGNRSVGNTNHIGLARNAQPCCNGLEFLIFIQKISTMFVPIRRKDRSPQENVQCLAVKLDHIAPDLGLARQRTIIIIGIGIKLLNKNLINLIGKVPQYSMPFSSLQLQPEIVKLPHLQVDMSLW